MAVRLCSSCQTPLPADSAELQCTRCSSPSAPTALPLDEASTDRPSATDSLLVTEDFRPSGARSRSATASGLSFGNYDLLGELGRGGMGVVYKARQKRADRLVALKVIHYGMGVDEGTKIRFTDEVRALARVSHPHVVAVYDVGEENGHPYFTMEFVAGQPLSQRMREGAPLTPAEAARLVADLAGAVQAAHDVGVLHRDIKPGNILLGASGEAKLTDFGLAKHLDHDKGLTMTGVALGTPSYMPPEQANGELDKIGPAVDVYALGATLYELLTGQPPFVGESHAAILVRVISTEVVRPARLRPNLSGELEAICLKCLERDPAKRYATARELAEDLGRWQRGEATLVRPWSRRKQLARTIERRWKSIAAVLAVAVVGLSVALAAMWWNDPERRSQRAMLQVDRAMQQDQRVVLVGPTGPPAWSKWTISRDATQSINAAGVLEIGTNADAFLELAPATHHDRYRISAELCVRTSSNEDSWSGIYFAHNQGAGDPAGVAERLLMVRHRRDRLNFSKVDRVKGDPVHVHDVLVLTQNGESELSQPTPLGVHFYRTTERDDMVAEPWRYIEVDVTPEGVQAKWRDTDGSLKPIGIPHVNRPPQEIILLANLQRRTAAHARMLDQEYPALAVRRLDYQPRGALGLSVSRARVAFRNVVFQPLPAAPKP